VLPDLEPQLRSAGIADVDALVVANVDHRPAVPVDEGPVHRAVVDRQPLALLETQDQVFAGNPGIGDTDVGIHVTSDDHVLACRERMLRPAVPNGQRGRGWSTHYISIGRGSGCFH
jgi:hypothetical protein